LNDIKNSYNRLFELSGIKRTKSRIIGFGRVIALFYLFLSDIHIQIKPETTQISQ